MDVMTALVTGEEQFRSGLRLSSLNNPFRRINPYSVSQLVPLADLVLVTAVGWLTFLRDPELPGTRLGPACAFVATTILILFALLTRVRRTEMQKFIRQPLSGRLAAHSSVA